MKPKATMKNSFMPLVSMVRRPPRGDALALRDELAESSSTASEPGIEHVSQRVAEEVDCQHYESNRHARRDRNVGRQIEALLSLYGTARGPAEVQQQPDPRGLPGLRVPGRDRGKR